MSKRRIAIDRLAILLKGVTPETARAAVGDLGHALMAQLDAGAAGPGELRGGNVDRVDAGTVSLAARTTPSDLRAAIAGRIAASIAATRT